MVSKRNFFVITLIMLLVLLMFQFSGFVRDVFNDYDTNIFAATDTGLTQASAFDTAAGEQAVLADAKEYIVLIGKSQTAVSEVVHEWCRMTKRNYLEYASLAQFVLNKTKLPEAVIVDAESLNYDTDIQTLGALTESGVSVIFATLPGTLAIRNNAELKGLLGISAVRATQVTLTGARLYDDFFVGGEKWYIAPEGKEEYQDMELHIPWYELEAATKVYMAGVADDVEYQAMYEGEDLSHRLHEPPLIWRHSTGNAYVFAINADYAQSNTALGIYTSMLYETKEYLLYPVVNAQSIIAINYPTFASENNEEMKKRYSRSAKETLRDIVWPNLSALTSSLNAKMTYMVTPENNYEDENKPDRDTLIYYFKLMRQNGDEAGWAAYNFQETTIRKKVVADYRTYTDAVPNYKFLSIYVNNYSRAKTLNLLKTDFLRDVKTVVTDYEPTLPLFTYATSSVLEMRSSNDGRAYSYTDDFRSRSIETALGYSAVTLDMTEILFPEENSKDWSKVYEEFATNMNEYWGSYKKFEKTTVSETDNRIRRFLAMQYHTKKDGDTITVDIEDYTGEVYFILRMHNEAIDDMEGGQFQKLSDGIYLVTAESAELMIKTKPKVQPYYG